jgi:hypothetical protein
MLSPHLVQTLTKAWGNDRFEDSTIVFYLAFRRVKLHVQWQQLRF